MIVVQRGPDVFQASGEERLLESVSVSAQGCAGSKQHGAHRATNTKTWQSSLTAGFPGGEIT